MPYRRAEQALVAVRFARLTEDIWHEEMMFTEHFNQYALLAILMVATTHLSRTLRTLWIQGYLKLAPNMALIGLCGGTAYSLDGALAAVTTVYVSALTVVLAAIARREKKSMAKVVQARVEAVFATLR
jgi:hypothetical protein